MFTKNIKLNNLQKGFTLIELLVVIAIVGILAVGLIATIDPIDKIKSGNDAKVISDVSLVSKAVEQYAASHDGAYPADTAALTTSGELRAVPTAPSTHAAYSGNMTFVSGVGGSFKFKEPLLSKKYPTSTVALYNSSNGKLCTPVSTVGTPVDVCP